MLLKTQIEQITIADIEGLVTNKVREGRLVDFKQQWEVSNNDQKKEFLHDISSFANTLGGHLVFGVEEIDQVATKIVGIGSTVNAEQAILRMQQVADSNIEPRIPGLRFYHIEGPNGGVIVCYAPRSWAMPHIVTFGDYWRAWARHDAGKYKLSVEQFKGTIKDAGTTIDRIKRFRDERVALLLSGQTPRPVKSINSKTTALLLHTIPFSTFDIASVIDPATVLRGTNATEQLKTLNDNFHRGFNFEGLVISDSNISPYGYLQVFRNGAIEVADSLLLVGEKDNQISSPTFEIDTTKKVHKVLQFYKESNIFAPIVVFYSLVGVEGYKCYNKHNSFLRHALASEPINKDILLFPEVLLETLEFSLEELILQLKPIFDTLWNASGVYGCPHFRLQDDEWAFISKFPES